MNKVVDYDFYELNGDEFECILTFDVDSPLMQKVFQKARKALAKKAGVVIDGNIMSVGSFEVPPEYFNFMGVAMSKLMKMVEREVRVDGFKLISKKVDKASFVQRGDVWDVRVTVRGMYVRN